MYCLKCLGVYLTSSYGTLYAQNYIPFREISALLTKWRSLPLSFFGCITSVKKSILHKSLHLFETLSVSVPGRELSKLQASLHNFIWAYKRHRLRRSVLCTQRLQGALGVFDLRKYYLATHFRPLASWFTFQSWNCWTEI